MAYYTWHGTEEIDWVVEDVSRFENIEEDRLNVYQEKETFVWEITIDGDEGSEGLVRCYCE
jgi:hypothetical protein